MGRLMIRLLGFPIAAQVFWRNGMLARIAKYFASLLFSPMARVAEAQGSPEGMVAINREQILVELVPEKDQLNILVRTELRGEQMSNLCWLVFAAIDSLVKEWYNLEVRSIALNSLFCRFLSKRNTIPNRTSHDTRHTTHDTRHTTHDTRHTTHDTRHTQQQSRVLVPCPHCMVFRGLDQEPYLFPIQECQQAATNPADSSLYCGIGGSGTRTLFFLFYLVVICCYLLLLFIYLYFLVCRRQVRSRHRCGWTARRPTWPWCTSTATRSPSSTSPRRKPPSAKVRSCCELLCLMCLWAYACVAA
jgi:hypothetical protein